MRQLPLLTLLFRRAKVFNCVVLALQLCLCLLFVLCLSGFVCLPDRFDAVGIATRILYFAAVVRSSGSPIKSDILG